MAVYRLKQKIKIWDATTEFPARQVKVVVGIYNYRGESVRRREYSIDEYGHVTIDLELRYMHPYLRITVYCVTYDSFQMDYKIKWHCDKPALMLTDLYITRNRNVQ